jgi:hypothetical protein
MKALRTTSASLALVWALAAPARAASDADLFPRVGDLLQRRCAMPGCHAGPEAAQGLRLERDGVYRTAVNVRARTDPRLLRVTPGSADRSLLYRKLLPLQEGHYRGPRMPLSMEPLRDDEIALVRSWIESFAPEVWGPPPAAEPPAGPPRTFLDSSLAHLPSTDSLGKGALEFRILHRFRPSAREAGGGGLYGLDGGAWISFGLAYGFTDRLEAGIRRTNLLRDYEAFVKGVIVEQSGRIPLSVAFRESLSVAREDSVTANRRRLGAQLILTRRFGDRVSVLLAPTYVTHTNSEDPEDGRDTGAVGLGGEIRLTPSHAITGEWIVQTTGVKGRFQGASLGYTIATARHAFQLLVTNVQGTHTDLYSPGGDLDPGEGEFRLGFNISRTFHPGP